MYRTEIYSETHGGIATCDWTPKNMGNGVTATYREANAQLIAAAPAMASALDCIVRRLQMDVDDGSRPDQWSMGDLIRTAKAALPAGWVIGAA